MHERESSMKIRKYRRVDLDHYVNVVESKTRDVLGFITNLSNGGFMMVSKSQVDVHKNYSLLLLLSGENNEMKPVRLEARSVWGRKDLEPDMYSTGFMINKIDLATSRAITEYLGAYS
jgi:c-di-GMP-binding flagellar brake protein YcgR